MVCDIRKCFNWCVDWRDTACDVNTEVSMITELMMVIMSDDDDGNCGVVMIIVMMMMITTTTIYQFFQYVTLWRFIFL